MAWLYQTVSLVTLPTCRQFHLEKVSGLELKNFLQRKWLEIKISLNISGFNLGQVQRKMKTKSWLVDYF